MLEENKNYDAHTENLEDYRRPRKRYIAVLRHWYDRQNGNPYFSAQI